MSKVSVAAALLSALVPSAHALVALPVLVAHAAAQPPAAAASRVGHSCPAGVRGPGARARAVSMRGGGEGPKTGASIAAAPLKQLHLATDAGFARAALLSLLLEVCLLAGAVAFCPLRAWAAGMQLKVLEMAPQMAGWTLLGLLSSSCCVFQIVLSALSLGCAGFNTVLGPLRPPLIAFTLLMQAVVWYLVLPHPCRWGSTAVATALSLLLTFSPELLNLYYIRQLARPARPAGQASSARSMVRIAIAPKAMGCISCVTKVRSALASHPAVVDCTVSLQDASAVALISIAPLGEDVEATRAAHLLVQQVLSCEGCTLQAKT